LSWELTAYFAACIFVAAIVRGYSGFGFSLLAITSLSLVLPPAEIVPPVFMLEVVASLSLLPSIWRDIHWRSLGPLALGCLIGTPFGVWFLATVPPAPVKIALAVVVLAAVAVLLRGYVRKSMPSTGQTVATGVVAGLLNGAFGGGGPPVVIFFFSSPAGAAISRASLIAFFIGTDTMGLGFLAHQGLVTANSFYYFLLFIPPLLAGQWIGARSFKSTDPAAFRRWVLVLLAALALLTGAQGLFSLAQPAFREVLLLSAIA
jgi:uncharacterized membrane protein YfcA